MRMGKPNEPDGPVVRSRARSNARRAARLRSSAIIRVEGVERLRDRPFSREVAVAYLDGRPTASWLVLPESRWPEWATRQNAGEGLLAGRHGLDPRTVATELVSALAGVTPYAESHFAVRKWLERLFAAACEPLPFQVKDAHWLARTLSAPKEAVQRAAADVEGIRAESWRAAGDATCLAMFILSLSSVEAGTQ